MIKQGTIIKPRNINITTLLDNLTMLCLLRGRDLNISSYEINKNNRIANLLHVLK